MQHPQTCLFMMPMKVARSPRCRGHPASGTLVTISSCVTGALCSRMNVCCSGRLPVLGTHTFKARHAAQHHHPHCRQSGHIPILGAKKLERLLCSQRLLEENTVYCLSSFCSLHASFAQPASGWRGPDGCPEDLQSPSRVWRSRLR